MILTAIIKLTRWREFILWTVPLTLLGGLMAERYSDARLDFRILLVLLGNCCIMAYAFMINDIEDAEDDKFDPLRAARNPIASDELSKYRGWLAAIFIAFIGLACFALTTAETLLAGIVMLILSHLYSWKSVRLKAIPVLDIAAHVLMLSALLMLTGYFTYDDSPTRPVWLLLSAVTFVSAYGQFYNQVRDFEADRAANLRNTASFAGKKAALQLSYLSILIAGVSFLLALVEDAFPIGFAALIVVMVPVAWLFSSHHDARGDVAVDMSGKAQNSVLIGINVALFLWFLYEVLV